MISNVSDIPVRKVPGVTFFVSTNIQENTNVNILKRTRFVTERDCLTLGYAFDERFLNKFELKNVRKKSESTILSCQIIDFQIGVFNWTIFRVFFAKMHGINIKTCCKVGNDFQNKVYKKDLLV